MPGEVMASTIPPPSSSSITTPSSSSSSPLKPPPPTGQPTERLVVIGGRPWIGRGTIHTSPSTPGTHSSPPPTKTDQHRGPRKGLDGPAGRTQSAREGPARVSRGGVGSTDSSSSAGTSCSSSSFASSGKKNKKPHLTSSAYSSLAPSSSANTSTTQPSSHATPPTGTELAGASHSSGNFVASSTSLLALHHQPSTGPSESQRDYLNHQHRISPKRFPPSGGAGSSDSLRGIGESPRSARVPPLLAGSPRKLISEENLASTCPERPTGWYSARRTYRSVAYGTWKVGGARKLLTSHSDFSLLDDEPDPRLSTSEILKAKPPLNPYHPRLVTSISQIESSADPSERSCLSAREPKTNGYHLHHPALKGEYQKMFASTEDNNNWSSAISHEMMPGKYNPYRNGTFSPPIYKSSGKIRMNSGTGWRENYGCNSDNEISVSSDCYSAEDYCRFHNLKLAPRHRTVSSTTEDDTSGGEEAGHPSELDQSVKTVIESFNELRQYATMRPNGKTKKRKKPHQLFHKRSASAGTPTLFSTLSPALQPKLSNGEQHYPQSKTLGHPSSQKKSSMSPSATAFSFLRKLYPSSSTSQQTLKQSASIASGSTSSGGTTASLTNGTSAGHTTATAMGSISLPLSSSTNRDTDSPLRAKLADLESTSLSPSPVNNSKSPRISSPFEIPVENGHRHSSSSSSSMSLEPPPHQNGKSIEPDTPRQNGTQTSRSESGTQSINTFQNWEEAYAFLRKELKSIRDRDYKILEDFQSLEQELRGVKVAEEGPSPIVELPPNLENAFSTFQSPEIARPPNGKDISDIAL